MAGSKESSSGSDELESFLNERHFPIGFHKIIQEERNNYRFVVCDDSGSMNAYDASVLSGNHIFRLNHCTRWKELCVSLKFMSQLSKLADIQTEFCTLNGPTIKINRQSKSTNELDSYLNSIWHPYGDRPFCKRISEIMRTIRSLEKEFVNEKKKAAVILTSNGIPTDGDIVPIIQELLTLPVYLTIRLYTNESNIVDFWNNILKKIESKNMTIVSTFMDEARKFQNYNPWFTYGMPMHSLREFGFMSNIFLVQNMQSNALTPSQIRTFSSLLFGVSESTLPDPTSHQESYLIKLDDIQANTPRVMDVYTKKPKNWMKSGLLFLPIFVEDDNVHIPEDMLSIIIHALWETLFCNMFTRNLPIGYVLIRTMILLAVLFLAPIVLQTFSFADINIIH